MDAKEVGVSCEAVAYTRQISTLIFGRSCFLLKHDDWVVAHKLMGHHNISRLVEVLVVKNDTYML